MDAAYRKRIDEETRLFSRELLENSTNGLVPVPRVWSLVEGIMARKIEAATGFQGGIAYIVAQLDRRPLPVMLSLGAGTCALELNHILPCAADPSSCFLEAIDVNGPLIDEGRVAAGRRGLRFKGTVMDVNDLQLAANAYDIILCWASLHHFVRLEHITAEINRALKSDGLFVTMDVCSRNGFLLWPETRVIVDAFWDELPHPYRMAHTPKENPVYCSCYPDIDFSKGGFECIRSEDILPALESNLVRVCLLGAHALCRRFFDSMFGPNFDLERKFDLDFFNRVSACDEEMLQAGTLRPETFFGVYRKREKPLPPGDITPSAIFEAMAETSRALARRSGHEQAGNLLTETDTSAGDSQ